MATPTRYDVAIYDDPGSIYEQAWLVQTEESDTLEAFSTIGRTGWIS